LTSVRRTVDATESDGEASHERRNHQARGRRQENQVEHPRGK
jgi:hypothetical protein